MDVMEMRFRMMAMQKSGLDTSPKIAEYGKFIRNKTTILEDPDWCYTEWIDIEETGQIVGQAKEFCDAYASLYVSGDVPHAYRYEFTDGTSDYWYGSDDFSLMSRNISGYNKIAKRVQWSILIANLDDCYAYFKQTGQIFFAGKNSIYYGHKNISELN